MNETSNPAAEAGTPENKSLHVRLLGERWIVESEEGSSLGEAADRDAAIAVARKVAGTEKASSIAVHSEGGELETTLDV
jgi:hypothetical protein